MLKRSYRLKTTALENPKTVTGAYFNFKYQKNKVGENRFAFVVSKKIDKRAVVRNFLKRKVRICVEEIFDKIDKGWDFVFYPKTGAIDADKKQVLGDLKKNLKKQGLIKE